MAMNTLDPELLLSDYQGWRKRRGLNPDSATPEEAGAYAYLDAMAPRGDAARIGSVEKSAADLLMQEAPVRRIVGETAGAGDSSGRPFRAFATMPVEQAMARTIPAARAMTPPGPPADPPGISLAGPGPAAPPPPPGSPTTPDALLAREPMDPVKAMPMRDRLTVAMWGNSRDTGGMRQYNEVAKRYGMPLKELPKTIGERRREAGAGREREPAQMDWNKRIVKQADGTFKDMETGMEFGPKATPEATDWNKRIVKQADGSWRDMETEKVIGPKATPEAIDWNKRLVKQPDGTHLDVETMTTIGKPAQLSGSERYINMGDKGAFDTVTEKYIMPGADRKDEYQGKLVRMPTGKRTIKRDANGNPMSGPDGKLLTEQTADVAMIGVWNEKEGYYDAKPMKVNTDFGNGSIIRDQGDYTGLPEYVDKRLAKQTDNGTQGTQVTSGTEVTKPKDTAPIGTIGTVKGKRMKKVAEGKWEPV